MRSFSILLGLGLLVGASEARAQVSDWQWAGAGNGYHVYVHGPTAFSGGPFWVQVGTSEWNQHLLKINPLCSQSAVQVLQGWLVRPNSPREKWSEATNGRFSASQSTHENIVARLVNLVCSSTGALAAAHGIRPEEIVVGGAPVEEVFSDGSGQVRRRREYNGQTVWVNGFGEVGVLSVQTPDDATALCRDGTWSFKTDWRLTCVDNGGIARSVRPKPLVTKEGFVVPGS